MDFRKTFVDLTQWVIPHGHEEMVAHLLPEGCIKDAKGNYYITIGDSETLFTCHLDTVSQKAKVNHVFDGDWIKTDGTTILGGDNKAGVCILMYLIEQKVSGTYYFFVGEEIGRKGSQWALDNNKEYFKKFKRAIAFDRRYKGSIITHQSSRLCASVDFTEALSKEMAKSGLEYKADSGGSYTDTYTFIDVIPECTNLSSGVWGEHTTSEKVDIVHLEEIAKAASKVNWEELPSVRDISKREWKSYGNSYNNSYSYDHAYGYDGWYSQPKPQGQLALAASTKKASESGLELKIANVDKYFNLTKIFDDGIYYFKFENRQFYFTISNDLIAIEEDLDHKYPYYIQHYVRKNVKHSSNLNLNIPTTFEELWSDIKDIKEIPFKPIDVIDVPYYQSNISSYFDLEEHIDEFGGRIFIDNLTLREYQFELDKKWVGVWEIINKEPYIIPLYSNDNIFNSFGELWIDMREFVPFRRYGKLENTFFNGGTKIKTYGRILDSVNNSSKLPYLQNNIEKYFDVEKIKDDSTIDSYYRNANGKIYFIEISPNGKTYLWETESGKASIIHGEHYLSFDSLWNAIKDKVDFKLKDAQNVELIDTSKLELKSKNIEKFFNLTRKQNIVPSVSHLFFSKSNKQYFFKVDENDSSVYLLHIENEKVKVILNYVTYKSFEDVWNDIKSEVDFEKRELPTPPNKNKKNENITSKISFTNENVAKAFNLKEVQNKHYVTDDGQHHYYFDLVKNSTDNKQSVYLWESVNGSMVTIIDGEEYNSFNDIWDDVREHVKFKKRIQFIQKNVPIFFNLKDMGMKCFYLDEETNRTFFIYCGEEKEKVSIKEVFYKDNGKDGVRKIDRMENIYYCDNKDTIHSFQDVWEKIKDVVPFEIRE
jgi:hypothetical protein